MEITAELVKTLRDKTDAGMMDCKKALKETDGDLEAAVAYLRQKGLAVASKRADRATSEGTIWAHIAPDHKSGVLLEVNCESDFVAKTDGLSGIGHPADGAVGRGGPGDRGRTADPALRASGRA